MAINAEYFAPITAVEPMHYLRCQAYKLELVKLLFTPAQNTGNENPLNDDCPAGAYSAMQAQLGP